MTPRVFVSYSRRDATRAEALEQRLRAASVPIWFDRRDIPVSVPWFDEVAAAVRAAPLVVACCSPDWNASRNCRLEMDVAAEAGRPVVPLDIVGRSTDECAEEVLRRLAALPPDEYRLADGWERTDLWVRDGRGTAGLLSRAEIRELTLAEQRTGATLAVDTRLLLHASRRRLARRRAGVLAALALLAVGVLVASVFRAATLRGSDERAASDRALAEASVLRVRSAADVYAGLREGSAQIAAGHTEYQVRDRLEQALNIPVPDLSVRVPGVSRFAGTPARGAAVVIDRAGATRAVGTPAGAPAPPVRAPAIVARPAGDGSARVDVTTRQGALVRRLPVDGPPGATAVSPDGRLVATAVGPDVHLLDLSSGKDRLALRGSVGDVTALTFSAEGDRIWALAGADRVSTWPVRHGRVLVDDPGAWYVALAPSDRAGTPAGVRRDGGIDVAGGRRLRTSAKDVGVAAVDRVHGVVALAGADGGLVMAALGGGERSLPLPDCDVTGLAFTRDGASLLVSCAQGTVERLDPATGATTARTTLPGGQRAWSVAVDASARVYVGGAGGVYEAGADLDGLAVIHEHEFFTPVRALAVADDGATVLAVGDGTGRVGYAVSGHRGADGRWTWDQEIFPGARAEQARAAVLTPSGSVGAVGLADGSVWAFVPGDLVYRTWYETSGSVRGLVISDDGAWATAATRDGRISTLPACPSCADPAALGAGARAIVDRAVAAGLAGG